MSYHIGKTSQGENIKIYVDTSGYFILKDKEIIGGFDSRQEAVREAKRLMLSSYISKAEEVDRILNSYLNIDYDYIKEGIN
ncbi:MAG: hypothetical protein ABR596_02615 [Halarsenatibacteraceae bacterium]